MWDWLPPTLRTVLGKLLPIPQAARAGKVRPTWERQLMYSARMLGMDLETAHKVIDGRFPPRYRYRHYTVPKRNGSRRHICEPGADLKRAQYAILRIYLNGRKPHRAALGFRRKHSTAHHVWAHAGAEIVIVADIKDFFPSTSRQRVKAWWHAQGYPTLMVRLLTNLTTYLGGLPQGAPTSPMLSNLVNTEMDAALHKHTAASGGTFTRYADDMVFSWHGAAEPPANFEHTVRAVLHAHGYVLNDSKGWRVLTRADKPEITGAVLTRDGRVDVPEHIRATMRQLAVSNDTDAARRLAGYRGYAAMITKRPVQRPNRNRGDLTSSSG
jgi:RNA-directed DNA polymerase